MRNSLKQSTGLLKARTQTVPVDDLLSDEEYEALLAAAPVAPADETTGGELEIARDNLTTIEFAQAIGVSAPTMRRWLATTSSPYWTPETFDQVILTLSERNRRVMIDELDHSKLPPGAMREIRRLQSQPG